MFGEEVSPEIDVKKEFDGLEPGFIASGFLCEGCGLVSIMKTEDEELKVVRIGEGNTEWEDY